MRQTAPSGPARNGTLLVIDQGSHASKALIFAADGRLLAGAEAPVATSHPAAGRVEHDAGALVASVVQAIDEACARLDGDQPIAAAGLATQRSTLVCWHAGTGEPLSPAISWQDRRNAQWLASLNLDPDQVRAVTGLVPNAHYGASKFRWCLDHLPGVAAARRAGQLRMGPLSSYLTARLAGSRVTPGRTDGCCSVADPVVDPANASRTLLWDIGHRDWSRTLCDRFGVPGALLPRCVGSRHVHGAIVTPCGPVPLTVCTGDQPATLFAFGRPDPDAVYVNLGTGAFLQRVAGARTVPEGLLRSVCWQDGGRILEVHEGTVNGAGSALSWLARQQATTEEALFKGAPLWLTQVDDPPLFINGVGGLGAPFWIPDCPVAFDREASLAERTVAVIESIVFLLQVNIEALGMSGPSPCRLVVGGGLARLDGLCQRLSDLSGLPVERPEDVEATALGVAWLLRRDPFSENGALASAPESQSPARFEPERHPALTARYAAWRALLARHAHG